MYYKRRIGRIISTKNINTYNWIEWKHHQEGKSHCEECMRLNGCWFAYGKSPQCPHHPHCHCTVEPIDYSIVQKNAYSHSDYRKFDPYLFNTNGFYSHNKEKLFQQWGYTVKDALWLKNVIEEQSLNKYLAGEYELGKLNRNGQRISIRIEIPKKGQKEMASFETGWMLCPNGELRLNTPYGGK